MKRHPGTSMQAGLDFNRSPLLVIWEVTRACDLACKHCRACAEPSRDPRELSLDEGRALIDQVEAMGTPLVIFSGGDPLQRDDLEDLVRHAKARGLRAATIPASTPRLTRERVAALKEAGLDQIAFSLDGSTRERHDAFRGVEGSYDSVMRGVAWAHEAGIPLQINSVFGSWNVDDFDAMASAVESLGIVFWEVFFLVPTGRGRELDCATGAQMEALFAKLHALTARVDFIVKLTEAPHFRRYQRQHPLPEGSAVPHPMNRAPIAASVQTVNAGRGFCFVDHTGVVSPSGFLPLPCGNVRETPLAEIYRNHPTFTALRDLSRIGGKCARCRYLTLCTGGSRARAYAVHGSLDAEEPCCAYEP